MSPQLAPIFGHRINFSFLVALVTTLALAVRASAEPPSPFAVVFIDTKTEKALGAFPYDRTVLAKAIDKAAGSGARGVVLKFFIDKFKSVDGDNALIESSKKTKLIVQARLDDTELRPNPLPERFTLNVPPFGMMLSAKRGWLPIPGLAASAYDLGFVDTRVIDRMPLIERYGGSLVKSLYLCCLELALNERAEILPGRSIRMHGKTVELNNQSEIGVEYPEKDDLAYVSFSDFLDQPVRPDFKDRIVIIAYDTDKFEPLVTPRGKIRPHRAFVYALLSIYRQFQ